MSKKREELLKKKKITVVPAKDIKDKFTIVSNASITLLDSKSFHIYCYLLSCCDENSYCYPSYDDIQEKLGVTRHTVAKCIKFLSKFNLIEIHKRKNGTYYNNSYTIYGITKISDINDNNSTITKK